MRLDGKAAKFYWVLPSFVGFFSQLYWISISFTGFLPSFRGIVRYFTDLTGFYWILLISNEFYEIPLGYFLVIMEMKVFYWVLPSFFQVFHRFYWVSFRSQMFPFLFFFFLFFVFGIFVVSFCLGFAQNFICYRVFFFVMFLDSKLRDASEFCEWILPSFTGFYETASG